MAKALGAGLPIGACIAREEVADAFKPGDHATTFGGGPVPCAAALAVLDIIESEDLVARAAAAGERLTDALVRATVGNPAVKEVRGLGLLIAIELGGDRVERFGHFGEVAGELVDLRHGLGREGLDAGPRIGSSGLRQKGQPHNGWQNRSGSVHRRYRLFAWLHSREENHMARNPLKIVRTRHKQRTIHYEI